MKRKLAAVMLAFAMVISPFYGVTPVDAAAVTTDAAKLDVIENASELEHIGAFYSTPVSLDNKKDIAVSYIEFEVTEPSWVYLWNCSSLTTSKNDGHSTHVDVYSDAGFTNLIGECGSGYWEYTDAFVKFLDAGTYYLHMKTSLENYSSFEGNINMCGAAIPIDKIFTAEVTVDKNKKTATVSMPNILGKYVKYAQYQPGNISLKDVYNNDYWKRSISGYYVSGNDVVSLLEEKDGAYSFQAKNNGSYTIMIHDTEDNRYCATIKVTGLDKKKPTVSGVKNGKTYKKAVTIKFSDKDSGIKSAKLNGKTIKSGKKVSKKGSYTLVVTDKAGNKKTVKFKIK